MAVGLSGRGRGGATVRPVDERGAASGMVRGGGGGEVGPPADLGPALEEARLNAAAAKAASTLRAYQSDWRDFDAWCARHGLCPLPAEPRTVALYISDLAREGMAVATVRRRLASIGAAHRLSGHANPAADPHVREVFAGLRRRHGRPQRPKAAILTETLRVLCRSAPPGAGGLAGVRDRAVLLVAFAGAFRRSELVALRVEDLEWVGGALRVTVARGKTDQEGRGSLKLITPGASPTTCPVGAMRAWLEAARIEAGPVFRKVDRHGNVADRALEASAVAFILKRAGAAAGMDVAPLGAHGLRSGFATSMSRANVGLPSIMSQTGHRSVATLLRYVHEGGRLRDDLTRSAGL